MAGAAASRRRKEPVDLNRLLALPKRLVLQLAEQLAESGIAEALAQLGSRKGSERQILNDNYVVAADDLSRELMEEVLTSRADATMSASER